MSTAHEGAVKVAQLASRQEFFKLHSLLDSVCEVETRDLSLEHKQRVHVALNTVYHVVRQLLSFEEDEMPQANADDEMDDLEAEADVDDELVQLQTTAENLVARLGLLRVQVPARLRELSDRDWQPAAAMTASCAEAPASDEASEREQAGGDVASPCTDDVEVLQRRAAEGMRDIACLTLSDRLSAIQVDFPQAIGKLKAFVDVLQAEAQQKTHHGRKSVLPDLTPPRQAENSRLVEF